MLGHQFTFSPICKICTLSRATLGASTQQILCYCERERARFWAYDRVPGGVMECNLWSELRTDLSQRLERLADLDCDTGRPLSHDPTQPHLLMIPQPVYHISLLELVLSIYLNHF
ncbi:hypothetical protein M378DRAFT_912907 [Amanita muscaria Koide BX008]|uniref:Uncharacterized protein n=1 Tax=Amanita muscaria (strain Koide BX008) TaxID=946122 RepID=A0A0C2WWD9_AMAMK|nr:hypothetical protein M378DRAFT_912907 [Amanita muscaria Koide BX008]